MTTTIMKQLFLSIYAQKVENFRKRSFAIPTDIVPDSTHFVNIFLQKITNFFTHFSTNQYIW